MIFLDQPLTKGVFMSFARPRKHGNITCTHGVTCRVCARYNFGTVVKKGDCIVGRQIDCTYLTDDGCTYFNQFNQNVKESKKSSTEEDLDFFGPDKIPKTK
jgi:hypothetical protein